jgi:regulator of cell morphogenesis and NO signaling
MNSIESLFQEEVYVESTKRRYAVSDLNSSLKSQILSVLAGEEEFYPQQFQSYSMGEIYNYLKASHDHYLNTCIPQVENSLIQLINKSAGNHRSTKLYFLLLNNYKNELIDHIEKEERVLFKNVEKMLNGELVSGSDNYAVNYFLNTHNDNVILEIDKLKSDMLQQNSSLKNEFSFDILFRQLDFLQRDLAIHGLIEDHVFIPKVLEMMQA